MWRGRPTKKLLEPLDYYYSSYLDSFSAVYVGDGTYLDKVFAVDRIRTLLSHLWPMRRCHATCFSCKDGDNSCGRLSGAQPPASHQHAYATNRRRPSAIKQQRRHAVIGLHGCIATKPRSMRFRVCIYELQFNRYLTNLHDLKQDSDKEIEDSEHSNTLWYRVNRPPRAQPYRKRLWNQTQPTFWWQSEQSGVRLDAGVIYGLIRTVLPHSAIQCTCIGAYMHGTHKHVIWVRIVNKSVFVDFFSHWRPL